MEEASDHPNPQVLTVLEALRQASHHLQTNPTLNSDNSNSSAIKALLELETESNSLLSSDPHLSALSHHLSSLKDLVHTLQKSRGHSLTSFLTRRASTQSISRVAGSIESEIQAWIDRERVEDLTRALRELADDDELVKLLTQFENRVSQGFSHELQDLILKSKVFSLLESVLCNPNCSKKIREHSGFAVSALIRFNKDVFVGQVLMGRTVLALIAMGSCSSLTVLWSLIKSTKSPLVDEIESNGEIPKIISFFSSQDLDIRIAAVDCAFEIGYYGRKEAIEAMLKEGVIEKLLELQRSEMGGILIEMGRFNEEENRKSLDGVEIEGIRRSRDSREKRFLERHPFASCVARFAVQLEVGEGLRQREKRAFKQEILGLVREACASDAEAATIVAEVLWGSSP
ncbi:hypothetical protein PVL29_014426 [Vitis rotundifolia]|uniref:Uncharacterized protein n=1 Tax=Vitis rotundifolia TaxID=103349 RepID=A0AA38ZGS0_VITRO|nr:hypothetical protein PVL29_014426 [Vitis rotundifolia]